MPFEEVFRGPSPQVLAAIPHRAPMLFVDEILEQQRDSIRTRRTFRAEELFFHGHYPQFPVVPGVLLCEAMLQSGAILLSSRMSPMTPGQIPVVTRMNNVKFKQQLLPGDTIEMEVAIQDELQNAVYMTGSARRQAQLVARRDFACALAPHISSPDR